MSKEKKCINYDICGNMKPHMSRVKGMCNECAYEYMRRKEEEGLQGRVQKSKERKEKNALKVIDRIDKFQRYVKLKFDHHFETNEGKPVRCAECGQKIADCFEKGKYGFNVAHIISKGTSPRAYYIRENSIFLCNRHHMQFDQGDKESMKVWKRTQELKRDILLNLEDYINKEHNKIFYDAEGE